MGDRRGGANNFQGCYMQVSGKDDDLDTYLTKLDFVACCLVLGRRDTTEGHGVLFIQAKKAIVQNLCTIAQECHLSAEV